MSSSYPSDLTDEELAFILQQEEYGLLDIKHVVLPPSPKSHTPIPLEIIDLDSGDDVILIDSLTPTAVEKQMRQEDRQQHEANDHSLGVLDVHELFVKYNDLYFEGRLAAVSVEWSPRMTLCAGLCTWNAQGDCRIKLSSKLLQFRSNKEIKETLLHECIHAFLFVTNNNKDRDGHGPEFLKRMNAINNSGGFNISIYHSFHDEVSHFRTHWWQCDKCQYIIKRSMNRGPGPSDWWFARHQTECGGQYIKVRSPPESENTKKRKRANSITATPEESRKKPKLASGSLPTTPTNPSTSFPSIFDSWKQPKLLGGPAAPKAESSQPNAKS